MVKLTKCSPLINRPRCKKMCQDFWVSSYVSSKYFDVCGFCPLWYERWVIHITLLQNYIILLLMSSLFLLKFLRPLWSEIHWNVEFWKSSCFESLPGWRREIFLCSSSTFVFSVTNSYTKKRTRLEQQLTSHLEFKYDFVRETISPKGKYL